MVANYELRAFMGGGPVFTDGGAHFTVILGPEGGRGLKLYDTVPSVARVILLAAQGARRAVVPEILLSICFRT